jgi:hypothetical protein
MPDSRRMNLLDARRMNLLDAHPRWFLLKKAPISLGFSLDRQGGSFEMPMKPYEPVAAWHVHHQGSGNG